MRFRTLAPTLLTFAAMLVVAAPADAQIVLPPTPVGDTSGFECVSVCIIDEDDGTCTSNANVGGTIDSLETGLPFSVSNLRSGPAPSGDSNACEAGTTDPVTLPATLGPGEVLFFDLDFAPTVPGFHQGEIVVEGRREEGGPIVGVIELFGEATGGDSTEPCVEGPETLCLHGDRFKVEIDWATNQGTSGEGNVVDFQTVDSGLFWFFAETNWEVVVKVLDACVINDRFWVFAGGLTNVRTVISVTDTDSGIVRTYTNPLSTPFQPVQDTNAFATCP
jgi:hypothetical protein